MKPIPLASKPQSSNRILLIPVAYYIVLSIFVWLIMDVDFGASLWVLFPVVTLLILLLLLLAVSGFVAGIVMVLTAAKDERLFKMGLLFMLGSIPTVAFISSLVDF